MIKKDSGYTMIELLLYVAIIGVVLAALTSFFAMSTESRVKSQTVNEVNSQGVFAIDNMTQAIRGATSVTSPTIGTTGTSLTLVTPTPALNPTIYSVVGGVLQVKEGSAAAIVLTNSDVQVTSMSVIDVTRSGTTSILQINLTLNRVNPSGRSEYTYQRTFTTSSGLRI